MAPQQRTFTIVPNPLGMQGLVQRPAGEGVPAHRPMTSKQAQKLHRQATKLPKRTKAEQAKWEAEQKRLIKEEDEKRRASNKARILREKKKEREQKIVEAKKRKGLPIIDVRPSQDLITRFVRGNGSGKKRKAGGTALASIREGSTGCDSAAETSADEENTEEEQVVNDVRSSRGLSSNPSKRLRTDPAGTGKTGTPHSQSPPRGLRASNTAVSALKVLDARSRESSLDVDDPVVEDLLRTQILETSSFAANSSAAQQPSPVQQGGVPSHHSGPAGKENIPPSSQAVITSSRGVMASPRQAILSHSCQQSPPSRVMVTGKKGLAPGSRSGNIVLPGRAPTSTSSTPKQWSHEKSSQTLPSKQLRALHSTAANVRSSSEHETGLNEGSRDIGFTRQAMSLNTDDDVHQPAEPISSRRHATTRSPAASSGSKGLCVGTPVVPRLPQGNTTDSHERTNNKSGAYAAIRPAALVHRAPKVTSAMPPPPPPSSRFKRPSQEIRSNATLQGHLHGPAPYPSISRRHNHVLHAEPVSLTSESVLPSSTQLFVLSNLDDILPSPSQELRELEESLPPPRQQLIAKQIPPPWKPPPRFNARSVQQPVGRRMPPAPPQFRPPCSRQPASAAPLPLPNQQAIEPSLPFFSTQDFMLSSQDIQDLECTTETPSKLPARKTRDKTSAALLQPAQQETLAKGRDAQPHNTLRVSQHISHKPTSKVGQDQRSQFSQPPRYPLRKSSQPWTPVFSSNLLATASQQSKAPSQVALAPELHPSTPLLPHCVVLSERIAVPSPVPPETIATGDVAEVATLDSPPAEEPGGPDVRSPASSEEKPTTGANPLRQATAEKDTGGRPAARAPPPPQPETPEQRPASQQKGRFFTASNEAIQLAVEKSLRTHKEEQRRREAQQRALELLRREEEGRRRREVGLEAAASAQEVADEEQATEAHMWEEVLLEGELADEDVLLEWDGGSGFGEGGVGRDSVSGTRCTKTAEDVRAGDEGRSERGSGESEADVQPAGTVEPQGGASRQASANHRDHDSEDLDAFDLEPDLEQELLRAEYDMETTAVQVVGPAVRSGTKEQQSACGASQETDYGDLDVSLEDLDSYI